MKTINEVKKEIAELQDVKKIKEYVEEKIINKSAYAEYSQAAQKEIIRFANGCITHLSPKKARKKRKTNKDQTTFLL